MAKARTNKKMGPVGLELPECPICLEVMSAPIFNCQSGHSLCAECTANLCPAICPICRQPMTQMRNFTLEEIISKAKVSCPNKGNGCVYTLMTQEIDNHVKECIFREMACPLGAVFGKCSWNGLTKDMLDHFKDRHPENCSINTDSDVELEKISVADDDRRVFLVAQAKLLFILTVKVDTIQKMAYFTVQHIGSKKIAQQHVYEIHVMSKQDSRRKAMFYEYCFNDAVRPDEIYRQGKCGIVPLSMLNHFVKDKKLMFRFFIKRIPVNPNQKFEKVEGNRAPSRGPGGSGPRGTGPRGPRGARGSGHHGSRPKSPGFIHSGQRSPSPFVLSERKGQLRNNHPFNFKD